MLGTQILSRNILVQLYARIKQNFCDWVSYDNMITVIRILMVNQILYFVRTSQIFEYDPKNVLIRIKLSQIPTY